MSTLRRVLLAAPTRHPTIKSISGMEGQMWRWIIGLTALLFVSMTAIAGSLGYQRIGFNTWTSSCQKPHPPFLFGDKKQQIAAYNHYVEEVNDYVDCVERDAIDDMKTVVETIKSDATRAQSDAIDDANRLRNMIRIQWSASGRRGLSHTLAAYTLFQPSLGKMRSVSFQPRTHLNDHFGRSGGIPSDHAGSAICSCRVDWQVEPWGFAP